MREIRIEKVTLNIGVGESGDKLENAMKLLKDISNKKPVKTRTMKRIPTWNLRPKLPIGCKVTLRGKEAEDLLIRLFDSMDKKMRIGSFDDYGNFSFGIKEYIDVPGIEYDVKIGIIGFEAAVTLCRPGFRVKKRKNKPGHIPKKHLIQREESMEFMKNKFNLELVEKIEDDY